MSFFASRNPSPGGSALTSPKFSPLGSPKVSSLNKIPTLSLLSPRHKSRSRSSTYSQSDEIKDYEAYITKTLKAYKQVVGAEGDEIIETFLFFKDKVSIMDLERPNKLNKFLENYLTVIKKLTLRETKKKFNLVQLL